MEEDLKQYLDEKFAEMDGKFAQIDAGLAQFDARFAEMDLIFRQDLERVETNLLTEFHKWASPAEARARTHAAAIRTIDLEMEGLTERVTDLEKKKAS
jgi:hypothetical protein